MSSKLLNILIQVSYAVFKEQQYNIVFTFDPLINTQFLSVYDWSIEQAE